MKIKWSIILAVVLVVAAILFTVSLNQKGKPLSPRLSITEIRQMGDGDISFEEKDGEVFVHLSDRYGDGHIFVLEYQGISKQQALETLRQKQAELVKIKANRNSKSSNP